MLKGISFAIIDSVSRTDCDDDD